MKFIDFIKNELYGWKKLEIFLICVALIAIICNTLILKDNIIAIISAICGILYTIIAGKGKISCYIFGVCGSVCYSILSWQNALWGNLLLYLCYYIPAQVWGFFSWGKNINKSSHAIFKRELKLRYKFLIVLVSIAGSVITAYILRYFNDSNPAVDGMTTFLSIIGMFLTVKRYIEQWIIWFIVNVFSLIMWINVVLGGVKAYSTLIMWSVYVILAIYFYFEWRKEISANEQQTREI